MLQISFILDEVTVTSSENEMKVFKFLLMSYFIIKQIKKKSRISGVTETLGDIRSSVRLVPYLIPTSNNTKTLFSWKSIRTLLRLKKFGGL